jgi:type IV secretory pathway VirB4 component
MSEKYGFIYVWRDKKRDMYYIVRCEFGFEEYRQRMTMSIAESWKYRDKAAIGNKIKESLAALKKKSIVLRLCHR